MRAAPVYLFLLVAGTVLPYWQFLPWVFEHGLDLRLLIHELLLNRISTFFAIDVVISAIALLAFIGFEGARRGIREWWIPVVAVFLVGVSLGLPLFLYMRERQLERIPRGASSS